MLRRTVIWLASLLFQVCLTGWIAPVLVFLTSEPVDRYLVATFHIGYMLQHPTAETCPEVYITAPLQGCFDSAEF